MNHKTIYTSIALLSCITALGSLRAMAGTENLPLPSYIQWLGNQPSMTRILNLPGDQYLSALEDPAAVEQDEALESSPNYRSFTNYQNTHRKLLANELYLAHIYPSGTFLQRLNDLLLSSTEEEVPEEVKNALLLNEGRAEQLQAAAEAFLKWYWSQDLNNEALKATLESLMNDESKSIELAAPILYKAIGREDALTVIKYYDSLIAHGALIAFQSYVESFRQEPTHNLLLDTDSDGNNALHYLAHRGSIQLAQELPQEAIDALINQKNQSGSTPLHTAIQAGNTEFALMLLAHPEVLFEEENMNRQTPLALATHQLQYSVVAEILKKKAARGLSGWGLF